MRQNIYCKINIDTDVLDKYSTYICKRNCDNIAFDAYSNLFFYNYYKKIKNKNVESLPIYTNKNINFYIVLFLVYSSIDINYNDKLFELDLDKLCNNKYIEFSNDTYIYYAHKQNKYKSILMQYLKLYFNDDHFDNNLIYFKNLFDCFKINFCNFIAGSNKEYDIDNINNNETSNNINVFKTKLKKYINNFEYIENPTLLQKYLYNLIIETNILNMI